MMTVESGAHGIAQIAQQVEAVGHLDRLRSAGANAVGKGTGPVAGDDLDARMILQPGGDGLGTAIRQQLDRLHKMAQAAGRDPRTISTSVFRAPPDKAALKEYEEAGIDRAVLEIPDQSRD